MAVGFMLHWFNGPKCIIKANEDTVCQITHMNSSKVDRVPNGRAVYKPSVVLEKTYRGIADLDERHELGLIRRHPSCNLKTMNFTLLKYQATGLKQLDLHELQMNRQLLAMRKEKISCDEFGTLMCSGNHLMSLIVDHRVKSNDPVKIQEVMVWEAEAEVIEHDKANPELKETGGNRYRLKEITCRSIGILKPSEEDSNMYDWLLPDGLKNKNALTSQTWKYEGDVLGEERVIELKEQNEEWIWEYEFEGERGHETLRKVLQLRKHQKAKEWDGEAPEVQRGATIKELSVLSEFKEGPDGGRPCLVYRNIVWASALIEEYSYRARDSSMDKLVLHNRDYDGQKITATFEGPMNKERLVQIEAPYFDGRLNEWVSAVYHYSGVKEVLQTVDISVTSMGDEGKNLYVRTFSGEEDECLIKEENLLTGKVVRFEGPKGKEVEKKNKNKKKGMHGRQRQRARRREEKKAAKEGEKEEEEEEELCKEELSEEEAKEEQEQEQEKEEEEKEALAAEAECVVVGVEQEEVVVEQSKGECCVCSEEHGEKLKILVPCGHKCICQGCMDKMVAKAAPDPMQCPLCMVPVICHLDKVFSV